MTSDNLILIGSMGAGKTTIGRRLARRLGLGFVDLDQEIVASCGAPITLIFDLEGEAGFREREHRALAEAVAKGGQVIATGGGAVLRPDNRALIAAAGFVVYLEIPVAQQWQRLQRDRARPLLRAPDPVARLEALAAERNPLYAAVANLRFPSSNEPIARMVYRLIQALPPEWRETVPAATT